MKIFIPKWSPVFLLLVFPLGLFAQWSTNSATNTVVCSAVNDQKNTDIAIDSNGNTFIVWADERSGYGLSDIYAQKLDDAGNVLWIANGVPVCTDANVQYYPRVMSDEAGGIFIVWQDHRGPNGPNGQSDIYAQHLDGDGNALWTTNGIGVCTYSLYQYHPQLVTDGSGGAIIVWKDNRSSSKSQIYAQRIDANGNAIWTANGILISADYYSQYLADPGSPEYQNNIVSDGNHGAIIVWKGYYFTYSVYAQRISGSGQPLWNGGNPLPIKKSGPPDAVYADASHVGVTSDIRNGAIISWDQTVTNTSYPDIYAQKIDTSGTIKWTSGGIPFCKAGLYQRNSFATSDKNGGAYLVWQDLRSNSSNDIYANHSDSLGNVDWGSDVNSDAIPDGILINDETGDQTLPIAVSDDDGNLITCFYTSYASFKIQKVDVQGNILWTSNGVAPVTTNGAKVYNHFATFENNIVVVWAENRANSSYSNVYTQILNSEGSLGNVTLPVEMISFTLNGNVLSWTTASETNNSGWEIQNRQIPLNPPLVKGETNGVRGEFQKIGFVPGKGTTTEKQNYIFPVSGLQSSTSKTEFRLKQIDTDGNFSYSNILTLEPEPQKFQLSDNFPNPFNPSTLINYELGSRSFTTVKIYDLLGREIKTLVSKYQDEGMYSVKFDATDLPSGIYFCRLQAGHFSEIRKMMLVK